MFESIVGVGILNDNDISQSAQNYINDIREQQSPSFKNLQTLIEKVYDLCKK
jgi:hypothetical protein